MKSPRNIRRRISLGPVGPLLLLVARSCHSAPLWTPTSLTTTTIRNGSLLDLRGGESAIEPSKKKIKTKAKTKTNASTKQPANKKSSSSGTVKTKKKKSKTGDKDSGRSAVNLALEKDSAQALGDAIRYVPRCPTEQGIR
jgi:hypothetical protein